MMTVTSVVGSFGVVKSRDIQLLSPSQLYISHISNEMMFGGLFFIRGMKDKGKERRGHIDITIFH